MNALAKISVRSLASLLLAATLLSGTAQAQTPDRVGRIAHVTGDVQFYSESEQAWLPAQLNAPVSSRNSVYAGQDGRAEIRFGSTAVSLDADTQLDIQVLDDNRFKADVPRGSVSLRVREIEGDESYELSAPAASYEVVQAGRYRVDAADDGSSVTVFSGLVNAEVSGNGSAMVEAGQALSAANGGFVRSAAQRSGLDRWAEQRDNAYRSSQSARYVSPNMTGYEELDANGRWASDPDYGNVWYPTTHVSVDWVPYRDGRWAYVAPWGWTWIDAAPWGFAPFHYGRWVLIGPRWAWMPGAYVRRPSYAPALVGFIGGSTAVSISIGTRPAVGWYPLPPWEHYRPAYAHHDRHRHNINNFSSRPPSHAWRTVDKRRVSVNQVQGSTVVPRDAFVGSRPVRRAAMAVSAPVLAAPHTAAPVAAPTRSLSSAPSGNRRPEFDGNRRGARESDQGRGERLRGNAASSTPVTVAPRAADVAPAATTSQPSASPANAERRPGFSRGESRREERQVQPAVPVPQTGSQVRESAVPAAVGSAPAVPPAPVVNPEPRRSARDETWETRRQERRPPPAVLAPQTSQPLPAPRIDSPAPPQTERVFASPPAPTAPVVQRRDEGRRSDMPAAGAEAMRQSSPRIAPPEATAPRQRAEPPAVRVEPRSEPRAEPRIERQVEQRSEPRPEPRVERRVEARPEQRPEPRVEPRAQPRIEPRVEPRPEPRQVQRVEPPPQREQKRAPEPERERRPHGERDKDK